MARRARYEVAGWVIDSGLTLPGARESWEDRADCAVDVGPAGDEPVADGAWLRVETHAGATSLRFGGLARFDVNAACDRVTCSPAGGVSPEALGHLFLDHVLPRILAERGFLVLHASAVVTGAVALGFCGETGAGKSTLAASFALAGTPLLADDALVVSDSDTGPRACPTYPGVRLWGDALAAVVGPVPGGASAVRSADKRRLGPSDLDPGAFAARGAPLARLFVLDPAPCEDVVVGPMSAREAFLALSRQAFRLDVADRARSGEGFERLARSPLLRACRSLRYPRAHARLHEVRGAVLDELARAGSPP